MGTYLIFFQIFKQFYQNIENMKETFDFTTQTMYVRIFTHEYTRSEKKYIKN